MTTYVPEQQVNQLTCTVLVRLVLCNMFSNLHCMTPGWFQWYAWLHLLQHSCDSLPCTYCAIHYYHCSCNIKQFTPHADLCLYSLMQPSPWVQQNNVQQPCDSSAARQLACSAICRSKQVRLPAGLPHLLLPQLWIQVIQSEAVQTGDVCG